MANPAGTTKIAAAIREGLREDGFASLGPKCAFFHNPFPQILLHRPPAKTLIWFGTIPTTRTGNLTYHFPKKEDMVLCLYQAMMEEHRAISKSFRPENELLRTILKAPAGTFSISLKYLFLFRDYVEIMRSYQSVASLQRKTIASHKSNLVGLFTALQSQGQLRKDLDQEDIDYLMDLSGLVRTFFMMNILSSELRPANYAGLQKKYMTFVNRLLFPYLTAKGILGFKKFKIS